MIGAATSFPGRLPSLGTIPALLPASHVIPGWASVSSTKKSPDAPLSFLRAAGRKKQLKHRLVGTGGAPCRDQIPFVSCS